MILRHFDNDTVGDRTTTIDACGFVIQKTFNPQWHRMLLTDTIGIATTRTYNQVGNVVQTFDGNGHNSYDTQIVYDALPCPITQVDAEGNRLSTSDKKRHVLRYTYDVQSKLVTEINLLWTQTHHTYDGVRQVIAVVLDEVPDKLASQTTN